MYPNVDAVAQTLKIKPNEVLLPQHQPAVIQVMTKDAEACFNAANIKSYERPAYFGLLPELMSVDNGLLTPKVAFQDFALYCITPCPFCLCDRFCR
jgi:hypothetical protein